MVRRAYIEALAEAKNLTPPGKRWQKKVVPAFDGDPEAVFDLMLVLQDYQRSGMVRLLYRARVAPAAFRVAVESAWTQTHHYFEMLKTARTWPQFVRWCRYAEFSIPADVPDPVTIYRGGGPEAWHVLLGQSWTLDRERADWFARRIDGSSWLATATIPRDMLMFYSNCRKESEVIPDTIPPPGCTIQRVEPKQ